MYIKSCRKDIGWYLSSCKVHFKKHQQYIYTHNVKDVVNILNIQFNEKIAHWSAFSIVKYMLSGINYIFSLHLLSSIKIVSIIAHFMYINHELTTQLLKISTI